MAAPEPERMEEALRLMQQALEALPVKMRYSLTLAYVEQVRKNLDKMSATTLTGTYTLLDVHTQALDAMEMSIKQHQITWEHQHGEQV